MSTRQNAIQSIRSFLTSQDQILLLTGTHQNEKHTLVLSVVFSNCPGRATILFRANHSNNIADFLRPLIDVDRDPGRGVAINVGNRKELYTDTMNSRSWRGSPSPIDIAIVYPIDSLNYESGDRCVQDLLRREAQKIFLVSWTDNQDFGWTNQFNPTHVVFDAEEENPEYHRRVLETLQAGIRPQITERLPNYASSTPHQYLVKILCRGQCRGTRWARLNRPYPGRTALRNARLGTYRATCLRCGYEATDNYNWYR